MQHVRLKPIALGLSLGVLWGFWVLVAGLIAHYYSLNPPPAANMGPLYMGYGAGVFSSILGAMIAFIDAFLCGALVAWLYNLFSGFRKPL